MYKGNLTVFCLLLLTGLTTAQINAPVVPDSMFNYSFSNSGLNENGLLLTTPRRLNVQGPNLIKPYLLMTDKDGYIAWFSKKPKSNTVDFKYHSEQDIYSYTTIIGDPKPVILNSSLEIIDTISVINGTGEIHDFQIAKNGNWLLSTYRLNIMDLSEYTFDGTQGDQSTTIIGFGVQEIDQDNNVVFEWNSNDHIHPTEGYDFYGYRKNGFDYCHGNAIEEDEDGHLLISFRHLNAIYKIHRTTGQTLWRLGGKSSDFTFVNDSGFSGQHDIRRLSNGNYSLFDNANMSVEPKISRGVEFNLDTINWTATKMSEFIHPDEFYTQAMGSYTPVDNGIGVIGYGMISQPYPNVAIFDNTSKTILASLRFENLVGSYRAHYYSNLSLPRPEILCEKINNTWMLSGPDSASVFLWSTGESTKSITITTVDTFQVWVPYGSGYIGSYPFIVTDTNNPCLLNDIEKITSQEKTSFKLYDVLGRETTTITPNQLYLKVYSSGKIEKILQIK